MLFRSLRSGRDIPEYPGEMAEWSNVPHSKCGVLLRVPRVRIPVSPHPIQQEEKSFQSGRLFFLSFDYLMFARERAFRVKCLSLQT